MGLKNAKSYAFQWRPDSHDGYIYIEDLNGKKHDLKVTDPSEFRLIKDLLEGEQDVSFTSGGLSSTVIKCQ